jgi:hypothetical protein
MIYFCILYLKYLDTYLETLHSHFQPNCHFKMFKNSGSCCTYSLLYSSYPGSWTLLPSLRPFTASLLEEKKKDGFTVRTHSVLGSSHKTA